jgi:hypothetical protein
MEAQNLPKQDPTVWYLNICDVDPYLNSYYVLPYKIPVGFPRTEDIIITVIIIIV